MGDAYVSDPWPHPKVLILKICAVLGSKIVSCSAIELWHLTAYAQSNIGKLMEAKAQVCMKSRLLLSGETLLGNSFGEGEYPHCTDSSRWTQGRWFSFTPGSIRCTVREELLTTISWAVLKEAPRSYSRCFQMRHDQHDTRNCPWFSLRWVVYLL